MLKYFGGNDGGKVREWGGGERGKGWGGERERMVVSVSQYSRTLFGFCFSINPR